MSKKELFQYSSYKDVPTENLTLVIKEGHLSVKQLEKVQTVLYRSRTKETKVITSAPTVTDYILKTEVPSGYTIVPGSERTEYSYRADSCGTK